MPALLRFFAFAHFVLCLSLAAQPASSASEPRVFCLSREGLAEVRTMIARDDPEIRSSYQRLLREADLALDVGPYSVVLKSVTPPSGSKRDYMSLSPYQWPDPAQKTGLPYKGRDGYTNPEWWQDYDRVPLERMTQAVETLALAYHFSREPAYATRAAHLLRVWFLDPATAMVPDLQFSQAVPGRNSGRAQTIDTRFLPRVVDAIGLLAGSAAWREADQSGMVAWCRQFVANVRRRADEGYRDIGTNISTFYHVQMASLSLFVGDEARAREMVERTKRRIEVAVGADGFFLVERDRTRSFSYSCFHFFALYNLATLGRHVGVDLWGYALPDGRGLRKALDATLPFVGSYPPRGWPFQETGRTRGDWWDPVHDELPVVLHHAARAYGEPKFAAAVPKLLAERDSLAADRLHLLCGAPLPGEQSLTGWLFRPSSAAE
ncbi:MAG TPA: alginate lyase family protein [Opitutaceae bacterium]